MRMIVTADWHLRETRPRCRTDENWTETQKKALSQIVKYSNKYDCDVFVVGDVFHSNNDTSFSCISMVQEMARIMNNFGHNDWDNHHELRLLAGNHDLPYHSMEYLSKSAINLLLSSENINTIQSYSDDISAPNFGEEVKDKKIIFLHTLVFKDKSDIPPNVNAKVAQDLLDEYPCAKWIFTGDMHKKFVYENNGRYVINSGCLIREVSDFKDYQCSVYYVDTDEEVIKELPITDDVKLVDDSYILRNEEREDNIDMFVDKLKSTKEFSLDFIENVKLALMDKKIDNNLKNMIEELLEVK